MRNRRFGEALDTWELMKAREDEEGLSPFRAAYQDLKAFQANDEPYGVEGKVGENGSWYVSLFKRSFRLDRVEGTVEELKLRCERGYVFFAFDRDRQYDLSDGAGERSLQVTGEPGTTFTLVQQ